MGLIHRLYKHLTGKEAPRDLPDEWKEPSRFQRVSIIIVAALLAFAAVAHEWFPGASGPRPDAPNVEPWPLDVYLFWGAVSWASLSLIIFAMNRRWSNVLVCSLWYAGLAALALAYFLAAY